MMKTSRPKSTKTSKTANHEFIKYWIALVEKTRGITPLISKVDAGRVSQSLKLFSVSDLEEWALYYLVDKDFRKQPLSLSVFLSYENLNQLQARKKQEGYSHRLGDYIDKYLGDWIPDEETKKFEKAKEELKEKMKWMKK